MDNASFPFVPGSLAIDILYQQQTFDNDQYSILDDLIKVIYEYYNRKQANPHDITLGLPINRFHRVPEDIDVIANVEYRYRITVVLINRQLVELSEWESFLTDLAERITKIDTHRLALINLLPSPPFNQGRLSELQYLYFDAGNFQFAKRSLLIRLTQLACDLLPNRHPSTLGIKIWKETEQDEVKIFISHSKSDGEPFARALKDHIDDIPELKSFFDVKNIRWGHAFDLEIERQLARSVIVVVQTDQFSSREWCRREVLLAKQYDCPIIIVNRFELGEPRSFPYLGNVPHLRFEPSEDDTLVYDGVILQVLCENLKYRLHMVSIDILKDLHGPDLIPLAYPPELYTLARKQWPAGGKLVYPDPPLGKVESDLLHDVYPNLTFVTPTLLPLLSAGTKAPYFLSGTKVGLSLSEVSEPQLKIGNNENIQDVIRDVTRYILVGGATIVYGGDLKYEAPDAKAGTFNFAKQLRELIANYRREYQVDSSSYIEPIINYLAYPRYLRYSEQERNELLATVRFHQVEPPSDLNLSREDAEYLLNRSREGEKFDALAKRAILARCLSKMRREMSDVEDVRILMGGKWLGFSGAMPGVLEEALIALRAEKPLYIIGGFGGAADVISRALSGEQPKELSPDYFVENQPEYFQFVSSYNRRYQGDNHRVDYSFISRFLSERGKNHADFGLNNGLTRAENLALFRSRIRQEIIHLILRGLQRIQQNQSNVASI